MILQKVISLKSKQKTSRKIIYFLFSQLIFYAGKFNHRKTFEIGILTQMILFFQCHFLRDI